MTDTHGERARIEFTRDGYRAVFDRERGCLTGLYTPNTGANWLAEGEPYRFGVPFVNGTQTGETFLPLLPRTAPDERGIGLVSRSGVSRIDYAFADDHIVMDATLPVGCGPRVGVELDLHFLDLPTGVPWTEQALPVVLYTADDYSYAYFIWQRRADDYLVLAVDSPFAAWRLKYDYRGRRILGFQVLSQADDVVPHDSTRLPMVDALRTKIAFAASLPECYRRVGDLLGVALIGQTISGGVVGGSVPLFPIGAVVSVTVRDPAGATSPLAFDADTTHLPLSVPGFYAVTATSETGRRHTSRVLCHEGWETIYRRCNDFSRRHFQHENGAFSRAIDRQSLSPVGFRTSSGIAYGDPQATDRTSCRTGEFGGFAGWAMIKQLLLFGDDPPIAASAVRYIRHWALNEGHEAQPYPGTVYKQPAEHRGRRYSAYHLYQQVNHVQYEVFLLDQLVDYYRLTRDAGILDDAIALAEHFICDHIAPDGTVFSQKTPDDHAQDYSTVDLPGVALLTLGCLLRDEGDARDQTFLDWAERIADHLVRRGAAVFPTEGEQTTEDGSIACTAFTLLDAYLRLTPKPAYLRLGRHLLDLHDTLMLKGLDCRMDGSSFRFWELNFEARSWGPSINAGHGWTLWTAGAKVCLYRITGQTRWLREAYVSFMATLSNVDRNGGIFPCYIPDMIPGTPPYPGGEEEPDRRQTTSYLAMGWPDSYSSSGLYTLVRAADCWATTSGLVLEDGTAINGFLDDEGVFVSAAPHFDTLALSCVPDHPLRIATTPGQELTLTFDVSEESVVVGGGRVIREGERSLTCRADGMFLSVEREAAAPKAAF